MKQDFSLKNATKWLLSFLISSGVMLLFLLMLTLVQKQFRFDEHVIRIILIVFITISSGVCAFIFRLLTGIKGYICGLATALMYSVIKLIMSLASGGVGKDNFLVYTCLISASLIGGILSANRKKKVKW